MISLAIKFDASPRPGHARSGVSRWRSLLTTPHTPTREEIERDAAAHIGVPVDLVGGERPEGPAPEPAGPSPAATRTDRPRGRLTGWWRDLVAPEPTE
ncbi:MAG: hypothetical protein M3203_03585, partial [Actinomycetota bacterium]|nr:hypothetical protein [Actinomycetota bacterium]